MPEGPANSATKPTKIAVAATQPTTHIHPASGRFNSACRPSCGRPSVPTRTRSGSGSANPPPPPLPRPRPHQPPTARPPAHSPRHTQTVTCAPCPRVCSGRRALVHLLQPLHRVDVLLDHAEHHV